ncbi:Membrane-associated transporter protein, partial [Araneus ventricosus]
MDPRTETTQKPTDPNQTAENGESQEQDDMHKTSPYVRTVVAIHNLRDRAKEAVDSLNEKGLAERVSESWDKTHEAVTNQTRKIFRHPDDAKLDHIPQKYGYVFRPKSVWELVLLSGTVCGIEFCYSAETAFVTPILLSLGLNIKFVTMIWCLSPLIGLFFTPILGSMSDSCEYRMGRRRPFILLYSIGILLGLVLVPNGHTIGLALGDTYNIQTDLPVPNSITAFNDTHVIISNLNEMSPSELESMVYTQLPEHITTANVLDSISISDATEESETSNKTTKMESDADSAAKIRRKRSLGATADVTKTDSSSIVQGHVQPWSIAFTVIGTMLLDFCSDACQSPSRTYLLDVSLPADHAAGLSTFTLMAGLGGSMGYMMGAIHWEKTFLGQILGGQVNTVFTMVTIIFIICLISTLCSFPEIPLPILQDPKMFNEYQEKIHIGSRPNIKEMIALENKSPPVYGATAENNGFNNIPEDQIPTSKSLDTIPNAATAKTEIGKGKDQQINIIAQIETAEEHPGLKDFLKSIISMPKSLKILCLTNLFCWMSLVSYSLYFTDFVAECVFGGDPQAPEETDEYELYIEGVQFGCWGMALYSLSCAIYSYFIEGLVKKIGAKPTYIGGQLVYCFGMIAMAITRHKIAVILLSTTAGIMYATLFTMPLHLDCPLLLHSIR